MAPKPNAINKTHYWTSQSQSQSHKDYKFRVAKTIRPGLSISLKENTNGGKNRKPFFSLSRYKQDKNQKGINATIAAMKFPQVCKARAEIAIRTTAGKRFYLKVNSVLSLRQTQTTHTAMIITALANKIPDKNHAEWTASHAKANKTPVTASITGIAQRNFLALQYLHFARKNKMLNNWH